MKLALFAAAAMSAALAFASPVAAGKLDDMKVHKETTITLRNGKTMKVTVVEMQGHMMALVPVEDLEALLSRAEGHSMTISN